MQIKSHMLLHEKLVHFKLNMQDYELLCSIHAKLSCENALRMLWVSKKQAFIGISTLSNKSL